MPGIPSTIVTSTGGPHAAARKTWTPTSIIPARFLTHHQRAKAWGATCSLDCRRLADANGGSAQRLRAQRGARLRPAPVLVAGRQFRLRFSSREHAPCMHCWILAFVSLSPAEIADIFRNNSLKNVGLLLAIEFSLSHGAPKARLGNGSRCKEIDRRNLHGLRNPWDLRACVTRLKSTHSRAVLPVERAWTALDFLLAVKCRTIERYDRDHMKTLRSLLLPGDGIGREVTAEAEKLIKRPGPPRLRHATSSSAAR